MADIDQEEGYFVERPLYYLDVNTNFRRNTQDITVRNLEAINNQIRNLLTTIRGTRPFRPRFGSELPELLFEPMDEITAWRIETAIFESIETWMSDRIILDHSGCRVIPSISEGTYEVVLKYIVKYNRAIGWYKVRLKNRQEDVNALS